MAASFFLRSLCPVYSQNNTNFNKTLFCALGRWSPCLFHWLLFPNNQICKKKKSAKTQCRTLIPPAPVDFACHPYTYFTWGVAIEEILHCGSNPQLFSAIVPSEREFIFLSEDQLKKSVDLRRSNSHLSLSYHECVLWLKARRPINHLHGRIAVCIKRLCNGPLKVFCQNCTNGIVVHFLLCLLILLNPKLRSCLLKPPFPYFSEIWVGINWPLFQTIFLHR